MVNFQSTPGLTEQDAKQVVSHFSSMSNNKVQLGAISSWVISAELLLFYQPPSGCLGKMCFQQKQKYSGSCLDIYGQAKKSRDREVWTRGEGLVYRGSCGLKHASFLWSHCCQPITEKDDSQVWPYASDDPFAHWSQRWWMFTWRLYVVLSILSSSFLSSLCGPRWYRPARLLNTKPSKAEKELLGLCQSQGFVCTCKSRRKDGGSWISSVWPQLNTRYPIKGDAPRSIDQVLPPPRPPLQLSTRSVNPLLNVRTHCLCAQLTVLMCTIRVSSDNWCH